MLGFVLLAFSVTKYLLNMYYVSNTVQGIEFNISIWLSISYIYFAKKQKGQLHEQKYMKSSNKNYREF